MKAAEHLAWSTWEVHEYVGKSLVDAVDWTTRGVVTPVKTQEQCGSCRAFSNTSFLEDDWFIACGNLSPLNEGFVL